jgi:fermentation-respiration switch protein FrsA (DUF1100 family)
MDAVRNMNDKPLFLIHSKNDRLIPYSNSEYLYKCLESNPKSILWLTENANHIESINMYTEEYLKRLKTFLDMNL